MGSRDYLATIRRNWIIVLLVTMIGGASGFALSAATTPSYRATASVYVTINYGNSANDLSQGSTYTQNSMQSYALVATSPVVLDPVIEQLGLKTTAASLASTISVITPDKTVVLQVGATSASPQTAADIANAVATTLATQIEQVSPKSTAGASSVTARTIAPAVPPTYASSPNTKLNVGAGLLLGLLAGVILAVLRDALDTRVRSADEVTAMTDAPLLGAIERDQGSAVSGLVVRRDPLGSVSESYRALRTNLQFVAVDSTNLTLVITSSLPNEGKSTIASNLALALAEAEQSVVLVDADLRRASIAEYAGIEGAVGLTTVLIGRASFDDVVQPGGHASLDILPAGEIPPNPSELLSSHAMVTLIDELRRRYDVVVIDAAPMIAVADAAVLSQIVDGIVVVADSTKVRRPQLSRTLEDLDRAGAVVLGIVLNKVPRRRGAGGYYGDEKRPTGRRRRNGAVEERPRLEPTPATPARARMRGGRPVSAAGLDGDAAGRGQNSPLPESQDAAPPVVGNK